MSWLSKEAGELYTVQALSADGLFSDSCSGFGQSCDLTSLMCGVPYTATVMAQDSICTSPPSQAAPIRTGMCDFIAICILPYSSYSQQTSNFLVLSFWKSLIWFTDSHFSHVQCPVCRIRWLLMWAAKGTTCLCSGRRVQEQTYIRLCLRTLMAISPAVRAWTTPPVQLTDLPVDKPTVSVW